MKSGKAIMKIHSGGSTTEDLKRVSAPVWVFHIRFQIFRHCFSHTDISANGQSLSLFTRKLILRVHSHHSKNLVTRILILKLLWPMSLDSKLSSHLMMFSR